MPVGEDMGMSDSAAGLPWGTQWDLEGATDGSVDWSAFLVTLGFQDGRAGGKAPVNRYFGVCAEGPDGSLTLGPFGMTMMAGSPEAMTAEAAYVQLLEQVRGFRLGAARLVLLDADGAELAQFVPSVDPE
jgi:heat shock protein HslJ